jgi:hypothetical protein
MALAVSPHSSRGRAPLSADSVNNRAIHRALLVATLVSVAVLGAVRSAFGAGAAFPGGSVAPALAEAVAILDAVLALDAPQPHEETLRRMRNGAAERAGRSGTGS